MIESKFGFYPCEWATFKKLKELNKLVTKAKSQSAAWNRWDRKDPKNRLRYRAIRQGGFVIRREVLGALPAPVINEFCELTPYKGVQLTKLANNVEEDYHKARYPSPEESVKSLTLSLKQIDDLCQQFNITVAVRAAAK